MPVLAFVMPTFTTVLSDLATSNLYAGLFVPIPTLPELSALNLSLPPANATKLSPTAPTATKLSPEEFASSKPSLTLVLLLLLITAAICCVEFTSNALLGLLTLTPTLLFVESTTK